MAIPGITQVTSEFRHRHACNLPDLIEIDTVVVVSEEDSQRTDITPRDTRASRLELVRQRRARLANDLEQSLSRTLMKKALAECLDADADDECQLVGCVEDVSDTVFVTPAHS